MNTDQLSGQWKQMKSAVRQQWGKLTDNDLEAIAGKKENLIGKLQERYGMVKDEAQRKVDEFLKAYNPAGQPGAYGHSHEEANREHASGRH